VADAASKPYCKYEHRVRDYTVAKTFQTEGCFAASAEGAEFSSGKGAMDNNNE
jgi:hypothetical protein